MTEHVQVTQENQKFSILLIVTDGIINDMQQAIDQIVRGSENPIGIIIVGVGEADFEAMDQLDGDEEDLYSSATRRYMAADIVQFVPFKTFKHDSSLLAKEVLTEVPGQLLAWMRKHNIKPHAKTDEERKQI